MLNRTSQSWPDGVAIELYTAPDVTDVVNKYIRTIRNPNKRKYAVAYAEWKAAGSPGHNGPAYELSYMGAQSVRMQIEAIYDRA
jgi:hypothetical protein